MLSYQGVPNPFSDNYSDLEVKALLLLEPVELDKITTNIGENSVLLYF
jgi:hypothetical protein